MAEMRKWYNTKTFWGALALALSFVFETYGIEVLMLRELAMIWTGLSVTDRFRKE